MRFATVRLVAMRVPVTVTGAVVLVELLGAIRTFEFVALAGNGKHGNGHKKEGE